MKKINNSHYSLTKKVKINHSLYRKRFHTTSKIQETPSKTQDLHAHFQSSFEAKIIRNDLREKRYSFQEFLKNKAPPKYDPFLMTVGKKNSFCINHKAPEQTSMVAKSSTVKIFRKQMPSKLSSNLNYPLRKGTPSRQIQKISRCENESKIERKRNIYRTRKYQTEEGSRYTPWQFHHKQSMQSDFQQIF